MERLISRHRNAVFLVALLFIQLVLLAFQVRRERDVPLIRIWVVGLITPVEKVVSGFLRGVGSIWFNYIDLRDARRQNRELSQEVGKMKLDQQRLLEEALEGRRLKALLDFRGEVASETIAARVIGSSASETSRVLFIDRGSNAGIRPNMPVITPDGIVGKVHRVFWGSSQVLVITDPYSGVGALLENSRVHGALGGRGGFFCELKYIVNEEKVEVGERVFTSGEDMIYPKGLPVGRITSARNGTVFKDISVQPFARLNRLEEVLVIVRKVDQEIPAKPAAEVAATPATPQPPSVPPPRVPAQQTARQPLSGIGDGARAKPQTDADKLVEAYRAAAAKANPVAAKKPAITTPGAAPSPAGAGVPPASQAERLRPQERPPAEKQQAEPEPERQPPAQPPKPEAEPEREPPAPNPTPPPQPQ